MTKKNLELLVQEIQKGFKMKDRLLRPITSCSVKKKKKKMILKKTKKMRKIREKPRNNFKELVD